MPLAKRWSHHAGERQLGPEATFKADEPVRWSLYEQRGATGDGSPTINLAPHHSQASGPAGEPPGGVVSEVLTARIRVDPVEGLVLHPAGVRVGW